LVEIVFTGGCSSYAGVGVSPLKSLVGVATGVFLPIKRLNALDLLLIVLFASMNDCSKGLRLE
jgi:hypothetical protein